MFSIAVRLLQSNLHRVRICTPEDIKQEKDTVNLNKDLIRVWSPEKYIPWKFEIDIQNTIRIHSRDQLGDQDLRSRKQEDQERQADV